MTTINNINDLFHILSVTLGDEYFEEVISGAFLVNDTIKVTKQGSTNAMYLGFDENCPTVIDATVWDEPEGYHGRYDDWPVSEGIYWDTEDSKLTPETIAADIEKQF